MSAPGAGYFDLQVNGYAGVDFNGDRLDDEALHHACARIRDDGVARAQVRMYVRRKRGVFHTDDRKQIVWFNQTRDFLHGAFVRFMASPEYTQMLARAAGSE